VVNNNGHDAYVKFIDDQKDVYYQAKEDKLLQSWVDIGIKDKQGKDIKYF